MTHAHCDHIGCLKSIKELTGSKVVAHVAEREWIEKGQSVNPRGITFWGKTLSRLVDLFLPFVSIPSTSVDIAIDHELSLEPFGLNGRVMHTPGHSPGSLSVLLSTGEAFVGDLAMNRLPLTIGPRLPIFGDDLKAVATSWRRLIDAGAREIFPAHGKPFSVDLIRKSLDSLDH